VARLSALYTGCITPQENSLDIVQPEGSRQWKIPIAPSGIEPATSQLVVWCLIQLCHCVP
jgi:hypothetical protein